MARILPLFLILLLLLNISIIINIEAAVPSSSSSSSSSVNNRPRRHGHSTPVPIPEVNKTKEEVKHELKEIQKKSDLVMTKLMIINRHGHRAPNAPYWELCPNDKKNHRKYNVDAEDLTGLGMQEEYQLGQYIRHTYHNFIGDRFNRSLHFFRAVGEPRILQSSMAVAQGIFPDGFGPGGFLPSRPQFIPIFSDMDTHEYLLDDVPCFRRAELDMHHWMNNSLQEFLSDANVVQVIKYMQKVCGKPEGKPRPLYAFIKTVADGMTFNNDYGLKVCGGRVTQDMLFKIRNVSLQLLMARLYYTDEQQTYTSVDLPARFLRNMRHRHLPKNNNSWQNDFINTRQESTFYFVHREALYAFAQFYGFNFNVPGLPRGELPVASALIMEKYEPAEELKKGRNKTAYIKFVLWTPYDGTSTVAVPRCRVPQLCEIEELQNIYDERVKRTGTWDKLCNYTFIELDHNTDIR